MKTLLTILFLLSAYSMHAQTYVTMSAKLNIKPLYINASAGHQFRYGFTEMMMTATPSLKNGTPVYFLGQGGLLFHAGKVWRIGAYGGYGYALESSDDTSLNKWVWSYGARIIQRCFLLDIGALHNKALVSIGLFGTFK